MLPLVVQNVLRAIVSKALLVNDSMLASAAVSALRPTALASPGACGNPWLMADQPVTLRLRLLFGDRLIFGPGKGELLARIAETGSIAAAGRAMGMSYKRAWALVEEMNAAFRAPLVLSVRGGAGGGGAVLSEDGQAVLAAYRDILTAIDGAAAPGIAQIAARIGDMSARK
jgi:molybdate transport system regulatory protein